MSSHEVDPSPLRRRLRGLAAMVALSACFGAVLGQAGRGRTLEDALVSSAISVAFGLAIGLPATLIFHFASGWYSRLPRRRQGLTLLSVVAGLILVMCPLGVVVLVQLGVVPRSGFASMLRTSMLISLVVGLAASGGAWLNEGLRARLETTRLELKQKELAHEVAMRLAADARADALASRVRPHFLFNALNTVLALIPEDPRRAEAVLEAVAALLRASLDVAEDDLTPLGRELGLVRDYVALESARFGGRLRVTFDVPEAVHHVRVPPFAVQTLVENAVKYAAAPRSSGATIRLEARREGDRLLVSVDDDGPGFGEGALVAGHGLALLRERLAARVVGESSLQILERSGGARVVLDLPFAEAGP